MVTIGGYYNLYNSFDVVINIERCVIGEFCFWFDNLKSLTRDMKKKNRFQYCHEFTICELKNFSVSLKYDQINSL